MLAGKRIALSTFVIRELQAGPAELRAQLPAMATLLRVIPGPQGRGQFWCARLDRPVKYRVGDTFDTSRCQPEFLGNDDHGSFLWVQIVVMSAHSPGQRLQPGMARLQVDLAYVVDLTLGQDTALDPRKVDYAAIAIIDDKPGLLAAKTYINERLGELAAALSALCGQHIVDLPQHVGPDGPQGQRTYEIDSNSLRYYTDDAEAGWGWRSTIEPDELLYWVADDLARNLAWAWVQQAPTMTQIDERQVREDLWIPQWVLLMTALDHRWGQRARRRLQGHA